MPPLHRNVSSTLDTLFSELKRGEAEISRRLDAVVTLRMAAQALCDRGLLAVVAVADDVLRLEVEVPGLIGGVVPVDPAIGAVGQAGRAEAVVSIGPDADWIDPGVLREPAPDAPAEQKSETKSETEPAPDVRAGLAVAPASDASPPSASDADGGGGVAPLPAAAAPIAAENLAHAGGGRDAGGSC